MTEKKDGTMEGLAKAFAYGVPYRPMLSPTEQVIVETMRGNVLAKAQGRQLDTLAEVGSEGNAKAGQLVEETHQTRRALADQTGRLVQESQQTRQAMDFQTEALRREIAESQFHTRERLDRMLEAFREGSEDQVGAIRESGDESRGISSDRKSLKTLISSGAVDETEALALVLRGVIPRDIGEEEVLKDLPEWKSGILRSGMVMRVDLKMEEKLSAEERRFLAKIRRALHVPIVQMSSLPAVASNRHIVPNVHHELMRRFQEYRHGTEGIQYGIRDVNDQLAAGNRQRADIAHLQEIGTQHLADISETGRRSLDTQEMSLATQRRSLRVEEGILEVTGDTAVSAREIVSLTRDANDQRELIERHTGRTSDNTSLMARLMEVAGFDRGAIRRDTAGLLRNSNVALVQREDIRTATMETADNTAASLALQKLLGVEVITRMDDAQRTRFGQLATALEGIGLQRDQLARLGNIGDSLGEINGTLDGIRGDLAEAAQKIEDGLAEIDDDLEDIDDDLQEINGTIQAAALVLNQKGTEIIEAIGLHRESLVAMLGEKGTQIVEAIAQYREALVLAAQEQKERDLNPEKIRADESLRNGIKLFEMGKVEKAVPYFDDAAKRDPTNFETYYRRAICYIILERPDEAEKDLLEALDFVGDNDLPLKIKITMTLSQLYYARATVHEQRGETQDRDIHMVKAIETTNSALRMDPSNSETAFSLAKYLAAHQLLEDATRRLIELLEKHPEFSKKIQTEPAFTPILPKLREVLRSEIKSSEDFDYKLSIDYIRENDIETGLKLIKKLIKKSPQMLIKRKIFDRAELAPVKQRIIEMIIEVIDNGNISGSPQYCFSIASLALEYGISNGVVFQALKKGAEKAQTKQDALETRKEIHKAAPNNHAALISLLKRHPLIPTIIRDIL